MIKERIFTLLIPVRRGLYLAFLFFDKMLGRMNPLFVLCYHGVSKDGWRFSVDPETVKKQLLYVKKHYDILTIQDIEAVVAGEKKIGKPSALITFDDGYQDIMSIKDFIKKENIKPVLFALSNRNSPNRKEMDTDRTLLKPEEITALKKDGWTIGCHSATHADFWNLSSKDIDDEIHLAKKGLEHVLGFPIYYFAYPKGRYTKQVLSEVEKAGYTLGFSMNDGSIDQNTNPLLVPRIGIDRTHSFVEFCSSISPSTVRFRKIIKDSGIGAIFL